MAPPVKYLLSKLHAMIPLACKQADSLKIFPVAPRRFLSLSILRHAIVFISTIRGLQAGFGFDILYLAKKEDDCHDGWKDA